MSATELAKVLCAKTKASGVDVRYIYGCWCALFPVGNDMWLVPGTSADTPERALQLAIERWDVRTPEKPFLPNLA